MTLIQILIGLLIERAFPHFKTFRWFDWLFPYLDQIRKIVPRAYFDGLLGVLLTLLLPVSLLVFVLQWLDGVLFGFFSFLVGICLFFYCLGPDDLDAQLEDLVTALERGDRASIDEKMTQITGEEPPTDLQVATEACVAAIFEQAHARIFGVLFWFATVGPAGAFGFRLSSLLSTHVDPGYMGFIRYANKVFSIIAWIPIRLTAAGFGLAGGFEGALNTWRSHSEQPGAWSELDRLLLHRVGLGALHIEGQVAKEPAQIKLLILSAQRLVHRSLIAWVIIIAVLTLSNLLP